MEQKTVKLILLAILGLLLILIAGISAVLIWNQYQKSNAIEIKAFQAAETSVTDGSKILVSWIEFTPKKPVYFAGFALRPEGKKADVKLIQDTPMFRALGINNKLVDSAKGRDENGVWLFMPKDKIRLEANRPASVEFGVILECPPEFAAANPRVRLRLLAAVFRDENNKLISAYPAQIPEFVALNCGKKNQNPPK